ncbi:twitching motility protein PilT [Microterricola gilva]|uniref:Twitching motility protein PilT n=1 Tax=Microterricola gilva TaxID=393267 RepID=A0A4Q8AIA3_9MICO|nr:type IV pilus twitching motility protein PilT [Microterricola gilva]RZU64108.1 twitching motility protein PilT [Microterricola gilva]
MEDATNETQGAPVDADASSAGFDDLFAEFTQRAQAAGLSVPGAGSTVPDVTGVPSPVAAAAETTAPEPRPRLVVPPVGAPFGATSAPAEAAPIAEPVAPHSDAHAPAYSALTTRPAPVAAAEAAEFEVHRFDPIAYASGLGADPNPPAFDSQIFTPPVADVSEEELLRELGFTEPAELAEEPLGEPTPTAAAAEAPAFDDRDFDAAQYPPPAQMVPVLELPAPDAVPTEPIFKARPYVVPPPAEAAAPEAAAPTTPIDISVEPAGPADAEIQADTDADLEFATLSPLERAALEHADAGLVAALQQVVLQRASDLHVTSDAPPMVRIDGGLRPVTEGAQPWSQEKVLTALLTLLSDEQRERFERELELDFAFTISANARFRVNFYQQRGAAGAAFRLIPTEIKTLGQLGVPENIGDFSQLPRGLVLVTGPTGSGKSTTLASLIDLANSTRADHIVTVEDPIEFLHRHKKSLVNQREVGNDTHSFANALKHVLRQDPDVILIGELRDLETISVALTAAETGHLVFATLHTQDAGQTIDRVIDVFPPHQQDHVRAQLASTLQGVVCQTLVKRASGSGRAVATEVLRITPAISNLIREGKTYQIASMMQAGRDLGMHTMDQHLAQLVNAGTITQQAAREKAHDLDGFTRLLSGVESPTESAARALQAGGIDFGDAYSTAKR